MRLRLVKMLQAEYLPLAEIRDRLAALSDAQVEEAVSQATADPRPADEHAGKPPFGSDRSQWERVVLAKGVELHVRRPLPKARSRQVELLLEKARGIMDEGRR